MELIQKYVHNSKDTPGESKTLLPSNPYFTSKSHRKVCVLKKIYRVIKLDKKSYSMKIVKAKTQKNFIFLRQICDRRKKKYKKMIEYLSGDRQNYLILGNFMANYSCFVSKKEIVKKIINISTKISFVEILYKFK